MIEHIKGVVLPDTLTSIGGGAFYGCTSLTSVVIGNSVTCIGLSAFGGCTDLVSVTFGTGSNVTSFETYAFPEGSSGDGGNSLREAYLAETTPAGTYTREPGGSEWTKQQ